MLNLHKVKFTEGTVDNTTPRPDWFLKLNPLGKVPVLVHKNKPIAESLIVMEYIMDTWPGDVRPKDAYERAIARQLAGICDTKFGSAMFGLLAVAAGEEPGKKAVNTYLSVLEEVEKFLTRHNPDGTFLNDSVGFGPAEAAWASFLQQDAAMIWLMGLTQTKKFARLNKWRDAILAHPVAQSTSFTRQLLSTLQTTFMVGGPASEKGKAIIHGAREKYSTDIFKWEDPAQPPKGAWHATVDKLLQT